MISERETAGKVTSSYHRGFKNEMDKYNYALQAFILKDLYNNDE